MLKKYWFMFGLLPSVFFAQAPANYYNGTENLSGYTLKSKLHEIISKNNFNWHYDDLKVLYGKTDIDKYYDYDETNTSYLLDIYSNSPKGATAYHYTLSNIIGSAAAEGLGWNREHMIPQSTYDGAYPMYSDLFYVIPADARINQLRSNYPYGVVGNTTYYTFTNSSRQGTSGIPNATYTGRVYEPIDEFKGDVARALLYFAVRYEGRLGTFNHLNNTDPTKDRSPLDGTEERAYEKWYIDMLLNWHNLDPVSKREIDRNNEVYKLQKNRNPFIDHPEWVSLIWSQNVDNTAPSAPSSLMLGRKSAYFVDLKWQASSSSDVIGYKIYQDGAVVATSKTNSVSVGRLNPNQTYSFTVKAYDNAYLESPESNTINVTTLESDVYAKDIQIIKYIEGTGTSKALEIANRTGYKIKLDKYKVYSQSRNGGNYYFSAPYMLDGEIDHNQNLVIINSNATFSCYDAQNADFASASPAMNFSGSQYVEISYESKTVDAVGAKNQDNNNADKSLYRKANVINPTATFDISEWDVYGTDYCQNLGASLSVSDVNAGFKDFGVYPNPVKDRLFIKADNLKSKTAEILDLSGKKIKTLTITNKEVDVTSLKPNVYLINIDGKSVKFIKK